MCQVMLRVQAACLAAMSQRDHMCSWPRSCCWRRGNQHRCLRPCALWVILWEAPARGAPCPSPLEEPRSMHPSVGGRMWPGRRQLKAATPTAAHTLQQSSGTPPRAWRLPDAKATRHLHAILTRADLAAANASSMSVRASHHSAASREALPQRPPPHQLDWARKESCPWHVALGSWQSLSLGATQRGRHQCLLRLLHSSPRE